MDRTIQGSNSSGEEIFLSRPDRSLGPTILQYKEYRLFLRGKNGRGMLQHNPPPPSAEVANGLELYIRFPSVFA